MLPDAVRALILDEQRRQNGRFIEAADVDAYLAKLADRAEVLAASAADRCRGLVAFYCNDESSRQAYITLVVVHPNDRGTGLGRTLVRAVLDIARHRGFTSCRLEVAKDNAAALTVYASLGFGRVEDRGRKDLLEVRL